MRIVAGYLKARQLVSPKRSSVRPTTDKIRSMIFSILDNIVIDADVLDLFAGTGALGIEAISRGASSVTFIDNDNSNINANIHLIADTDYRVIKKDVFKLENISNKWYNIIFIDPPYGVYDNHRILDIIDKQISLADDIVIVYEEFYKTIFLAHSSFHVYDERRTGDSIVRFLRYVS